MSNKCAPVVPLALVFLCVTGCVVNKAISAGAVADNLAVEKAQNEMLLLNVLRGKDHRPMYVTGISKITGSIKAEASLNVTAPFGSFQGERSSSLSAPYYVATPSATYSSNPSFEDNVFDTSEFMHGFLTPVSREIFAYYWNLGFYRQVLFHLMVLKVQVTIEHCGEAASGKELVGEYIFSNNHERGNIEPKELKRFAEWVNDFLVENPQFVEGKAESLWPTISDTEAKSALLSGLKEGLTLTQIGAKEFQFQRLEPPRAVLKLGNGLNQQGVEINTLQNVYDFMTSKDRKVDGRDYYQHWELSPADTGDQGCKADSIAIASDGKTSAAHFNATGLITLTDQAGTPHHARMTITLFLRSPEAILYYLGELARIEEGQGQAPYICLDGKLEPLFVVRRSSDGGCTKSLVAVTDGDGVHYYIPAPDSVAEQVEEDKLHCSNEFELRKLACDPGRSMEVLTVVSQLIALQKSAKDLPTTSVVRVVGQ